MVQIISRPKNSPKKNSKKVGAAPTRIRLTEEQRMNIVILCHAHSDFEAIAETVGCCSRTVKRWWERYQKEGNLRNRPVPGRPVAVTPREKRLLFRTLENDRELSVEEMREQCGLKHVSNKTIYRLLLDHPEFYGGWKSKAPSISREKSKKPVGQNFCPHTVTWLDYLDF